MVDAQGSYTLVYARGPLVAATKNVGGFDVEYGEKFQDAAMWCEDVSCSSHLTKF